MSDTGWVWRDRDGKMRNRQALDSILTAHSTWLRTGGKRGKKADLSGHRLVDANLADVDLTRAAIRNANLAGANLRGTVLDSADLSDASLARSDLTNARLRGTILDRANLALATLRGADFSGAVSDKLDLGGAHVEGVDFTRARWLREIDWRANSPDHFFDNEAYYDDHTRFPANIAKPSNLNALGTRFTTTIFDNFGRVLLIAGASLIFLIVIAAIAEGKKEKTAQKQIAHAEESVVKAASLAEHVQGELQLIMERERVNMARALFRSRWLFVIGTSLMVLSVFAPLLSAYLYTGSSNGDWHLLAFGVGVGLLFLAAARGIARQEAHQRDTYFQLAMRVAQYERFLSATRIVQRASDGDPKPINYIGALIVRELLQSSTPPTLEAAKQDGNVVLEDTDLPLAQLLAAVIGGRK